MSVTILDVLRNADFNMNYEGNRPLFLLAHAQVHNARVLLEKGYGIWDDFDDVMTECNNVEDVPEWTPSASKSK